MKASELIKKLEQATQELGVDPEVYFDTEACKFDFHIGKINDVSWDKDIPDTKEMVMLFFADDHYNHSGGHQIDLHDYFIGRVRNLIKIKGEVDIDEIQRELKISRELAQHYIGKATNEN